MSQVVAGRQDVGPVVILLHPDVIPIVDVFRSFSGPDEGCDLALLESPEQALAARTCPERAKAIISDAMLLAFGLWRKRGAPLTCEQAGSRAGSLDEYRLVTWIAASRIPESRLAVEAVASLKIPSPDYLAVLAASLIRQIDRGGLALPAPALSSFRGLNGGGHRSPPIFPDEGASSFQFRF